MLKGFNIVVQHDVKKMLERVYNKIEVRPRAFPYRNSPSSCYFHPSSEWSTSAKESYYREYTPGPEPTCPLARPISRTRNTPHSKNVQVIRRIHNQPVCKVLTKPEADISQDDSMSSVTRSAYTPLKGERRHSYKPSPKTTDTGGILPEDLEQQKSTQTNVCSDPDKVERFLPACSSTARMCVGNPFQYVTRKKRKFDIPRDKGVFYGMEAMPHTIPFVPDHDSVSSLCGKEFTRRRPTKGRPATLVAKNFDGGAPPLVEISSAFQERYSDLLKSNSVL